MFEFRSALFQGDRLLQAIAGDSPTAEGIPTRITPERSDKHPAVRKLQQALLDWDPSCLPLLGITGTYGGESVAGVRRFKRVELGRSELEITDEVSPMTVRRLDTIRAVGENKEQQWQGGRVRDIPFVKFVGTPTMITPTVALNEEVWASYDIANLGGAPTTGRDQVWCSVVTHGFVHEQQHHDLDQPVVGPDGASHHGTVHVRGALINLADCGS